MENLLHFLPSKAVGAIHYDVARRQHYVVTHVGIKKADAAVVTAVARGYALLQQRHQKALKKRTVIIGILVITSVLLAVFR